jgi:hypothetical protein
MLLLSISASSIWTDHLSSSEYLRPSENVRTAENERVTENVREAEKVTATDTVPSQPTLVKNAAQTARHVTADGAQPPELSLVNPSSQSISIKAIDAENIDPRLERCWQHQVQGLWLACSSAGVLWLKYQTPDTTQVLQLSSLTGSQVTPATLAAPPATSATWIPAPEHFSVVLTQRLAGASPLPAVAGLRWWWHDGTQVFHIDERCVWSMLQSSTTQTSQRAACEPLQPRALPLLPPGWKWQPIVTVGHSADAGQPDWISLIALDRKTQQQPFTDASREPALITLWPPQLRLQSTQSTQGAQGAIAIWQYVPNSTDNEKIWQYLPNSLENEKIGQNVPNSSDNEKIEHNVPNDAERLAAHGEAHGADDRPALLNARVPNPDTLWQQLHFVMPSAMRPDAGPWLQPGATTAAPWFYLLDRQGMVLQLMPTPSVAGQNPTLQSPTVPNLTLTSLPVPHAPLQTGGAPTSPVQTYQSRLVADLRQLHAYVWPTLQVFRHQHSGMVSSIEAQANPAAAHALANNPAVSRMTHYRNLSRHLTLSPPIPTQRPDHEQLLLQASPLRPLTTSGPVATHAQNKLDGAALSYKPKSQSITSNDRNGVERQAPRYGSGHYLISLDMMPEQPAIVWDDLQNADHPKAMAPGADPDGTGAIAGWYSFQAMSPLQAPFVIAGVLYQPLRDVATRVSATKDTPKDATVTDRAVADKTGKETTASNEAATDTTATNTTTIDATARFALMARHLYLGTAIYSTTTASITVDASRHVMATSQSVNARHAKANRAQWNVAQPFFQPLLLPTSLSPSSASNQRSGLQGATLTYWSSGQWQLKRWSLKKPSLKSQSFQTPSFNNQARSPDHQNQPTAMDEIALFYRVAGATDVKHMPEQPVIPELQAISPLSISPLSAIASLQARQLPAAIPLSQAQPAVTWQRLATYMFEMEDF